MAPKHLPAFFVSLLQNHRRPSAYSGLSPLDNTHFMARHFAPILLFACSLLSFFACEEPLEVDPSVSDARLVVISNFAEGKAIEVTVSRSRQIGNTGPDQYITDAEVDLYWENNFLERLRLVVPKDPEQPPFYRSWELRPVAGVEYRIRVVAPGYQPVMATSRVPNSVKISSFVVHDLQREIVAGGSINRYTLHTGVDFDDPAGEVNYYHLGLFQQINTYQLEGQDTMLTGSYLRPVTFSPLNDENGFGAHFNYGLLFEDKPFQDGIQMTFSIDLDPSQQLLGKLYAELRTLSEEYYLYYTSLSRSENTAPNPLNPIIIYDNIENGDGIFAAYSHSVDSIQVAR